MDLAINGRQDAIFAWVSEISDRGTRSYQNELLKFAELFFRLFQYVRDTIDVRNSSAAFKPSERIRREQLCSGRGRNLGCHSKPFSIQSFS